MNDQAQAVMRSVFGEGYEWWDDSNRASVEAVADRLLSQGLSVAAAVDIVGTISRAIHAEYGC